MADPVVHITNGVPDSGTGNITTLGAVVAALPAALGAGGGLKVDGSGTALPISGTVAISGSVTLAALPALIAGTAIIGKVGIDQTTDGTTNAVRLLAETTKVIGVVRTSDGSGNLLTSTANALDVNIKSGGASGGTSSTVGAAAPAIATAVGFSDGTNMQLGRIKPASTAPTATDPAIVVAISPNSVNANGSATSANSAPVVVASDQAPIAIKGNTVVQAASSTITRPANTTAYASGQLVANSVTAGSVNNLQFTTLARVSGGSGVIVGAQVQKSSNVITGAAFRLHLFNTAPTYTSAGDGSTLASVVVASAKGYLGYIDITTMIGFSDVAWGSGAPDNTRGSIPYVATAQTIFGLLEARGAYTPVSGEVFTITLDALQD